MPKNKKTKHQTVAPIAATEEEEPRFSVPPMTVSFAVGCLVALLAPFYVSGFWPSTLDLLAGAALAPQALFLGITSLVCLFVGMAGRVVDEEKSPKSDVEFFVAVFLGWYAISLVLAQYRHDAILETARAGGVLCWFFLVREWFKKLEPEKFASYLLLLIGCITAGTLVVVVPALVEFARTQNPRQFGTFYNPNLFANYCAMAAPLAAGAAFYAARLTGNYKTAGKVLSWCFGVAALLIVAGLLVTSSKGGMLALLSAAIVFIIALSKVRGSEMKAALSRHQFIWIPVFLLLCAGGVFLMSQTLWPRLQGALQDNHSAMFRWYTWVATVQMALAKPLFGWGPGSFPDIFPLFSIAGYTRSAHQSWLQLAAENGWPAMIILLLACGAAWRGGWQALKTSRFPIAAGMLAALMAFVVHGMVDSGWGIISIGWLLMLVLAVLATLEVKPEHAAPPGKPVSLNWPWLAAALVVGGLSYVTQKTAQGEDLRAQSQQLMSEKPQEAFDVALRAVNSDPASTRLWENLARIQWALGKDATLSYQKIIELQPLRAAGYFSYARYLQNTDPLKNTDKISELYDKAVSLDNHDTTLRMARAKWKLKHQNASGWDDLRYILQLQEMPYGKFPAVPENVNFDYGKAALKLARHALDQGNSSAAKTFLEIAAKELKKANKYINSAYQQKILNSVGKNNDQERAAVAEMQSNYQSMKERLQLLQQSPDTVQ